MGGRQRTLGLIVGLAGAALAGYTLFTLLSSPGCVGVAFGPCPDFPVGLVLGSVLAAAGMFMGGGMLVLFMAIGLGALAVAALGVMPQMTSFGWTFGGMFFLGGLLPLFLGIVLRRAGAAKQAMAAELMQTGVRGIGTIVEVGDTGTTINNNPRIVIRMRIEPDDGSAAVERSKKATVSRVAVPRVGERYPAWFDRMDPDKWMFATDMDETAPAEVKEMFARARAGADGTAASQPEGGPVEELAGLTALWKEGALTDAEFAEAKAKLLSRIGR
jgi:membrane protein implicated in regulation of membrane protease activity